MHLNFEQEGDGPLVILIPGMIVSQKDWHLVRPMIASAGYRVISVDPPGHGRSEKPTEPGAYTPEAILDALDTWIEDVREGKQVRLVGHSLGSFWGLEYCLRHPERVKCLVLLSPFCHPKQISGHLQPLAKQVSAAKWFKQKVPGWLVNKVSRWDQLVLRGISAEDRHQIALDFKRTSPHIMDLLVDLPDIRPQLKELKTPSLLIWGEHDSFLKPRSFRALASRINAECYPIQSARHVPQLSHPHEVAEAIVNFFNH